jgi:hypothetical protein
MADITNVTPPQELIYRLADRDNPDNMALTSFEEFRGYDDFVPVELVTSMTSQCLGSGETEIDALLEKRQTELHDMSVQLLQIPANPVSPNLNPTGYVSDLTYLKRPIVVQPVISAKRTINLQEYAQADISFDIVKKIEFAIAKEMLHGLGSLIKNVNTNLVTFLKAEASNNGGQGTFFPVTAPARRIPQAETQAFKKIQVNCIQDKFPMTQGSKVKVLASAEAMVMKNEYDELAAQNARNASIQLAPFDFFPSNSISVDNAVTDESLLLVMHEGGAGIKYWTPPMYAPAGYETFDKTLSVMDVPAGLIGNSPAMRVGVYMDRDILNSFGAAPFNTQMAYLNRTWNMIFFVFPVFFTPFSTNPNHKAIVQYVRDI